MEKKLVVIGMLGTILDAGKMPDRWERWRPTVAACMHPDLPVSRIDILRRDDYGPMNRRVMNDIRTISPQTETVEHVYSLDDPWDFEKVYAMLYDFAKAYPFDTEHEDYLIHMTTGTHVMQICLFLLVESRHIPARLLQTQPLPKEQMKPQGTWSIIDLDLSRYDQIAARFKAEEKAGVHFLKAGIDPATPSSTPSSSASPRSARPRPSLYCSRAPAVRAKRALPGSSMNGESRSAACRAASWS